MMLSPELERAESSLKPTLIASIGLSPAVLTETVWALATAAEEPVVPKRIIVVTTSLGRKRLVESMFARGGWAALRERLEGAGVDTAGRLQFGDIGDSIRVFPSADRSSELDDIRTEEENGVVAEFLSEIVRGLAEDEGTPIIASLAGGRKATGALLHSVMTLFGRAHDRLTHVLVDPPFDRIPQFLFPGFPEKVLHPDSGEEISTAGAGLRLAEVPFVPLRYLFQRDLQRSAGSYARLISEIRGRVLNLEHDLEVRLNPELGELFVNGKPIQLSPFEYVFYLVFAERAVAGLPPVGAYADLEESILKAAGEISVRSEFSHWSRDVLERPLDLKEDARKWAASIRTKFRNAGFDPHQVERLVPGKGHLAIQVAGEDLLIEPVSKTEFLSGKPVSGQL